MRNYMYVDQTLPVCCDQGVGISRMGSLSVLEHNYQTLDTHVEASYMFP